MFLSINSKRDASVYLSSVKQVLLSIYTIIKLYNLIYLPLSCLFTIDKLDTAIYLTQVNQISITVTLQLINCYCHFATAKRLKSFYYYEVNSYCPFIACKVMEEDVPIALSLQLHVKMTTVQMFTFCVYCTYNICQGGQI